MVDILLDSWLKVFSSPENVKKFAHSLVKRNREVAQTLADALADALGET